ncbi:MAG: ABC transporter permease [Polyangiaceae bacterium]
MTTVARAASRIFAAFVIVWGVTSLAWLLTVTLPGDPARALLGPSASAADISKAREIYGLDRPLGERYARFVGRLVHRAHDHGPHASCGEIGAGLHADLGFSFTYRKPVIELVKKRAPATLELALAALFVQLLLGGTLGALAGARRGGRFDTALVAITSALSSAPTFVTGLVLQYVLAVRLDLLPLDGRIVGPQSIRYLVLPALTLGFYGTALTARLVRAELGDALAEPCVRTARAKGASRLRALALHASRLALPPVAQLAALELGALVGGAVVTEKLFRWPGLGDLAVLAIFDRDAPTVVGITLIASSGVVVATMLADLLALWLDPRTRTRAP